MKKVSVGLVSLGCPKNLVDGEVMLGHLQRRGHALVADPRQADVIVVNTCAFIDRAKQESVDAILEMAQEKQNGQARRLVVTGCLAQRYDAELRREIPEIDATLGTGQVDDILAAVEGADTRTDADARPADLDLRPHLAARALHAALARVREDQRGLRLHVHLLHHSQAAGPAPQPAPRRRRPARRRPWPRAACGSWSSSPRTPRATAWTSGCVTGSPRCCAAWAAWTGCAGSA